MKPFTVVTEREFAQSRLAELWLQSDAKAAVTRIGRRNRSTVGRGSKVMY